MRTHTGENAFSPKVSGSAFSERSYLKNHVKTQTGREQFFVKSVDLHFIEDMI